MKTMKNLLAVHVIAGLSLFVLMGFPSLTFAQEYPTKPITVYVGFTAGATVDVLARALASGAEKILGVPVMVENKEGALGTVAAALLASQKPDGYKIGVAATGVMTYIPLLYKTSYEPLNAFTPIMQFSEFIGGVAVSSDSPFKTINDFIAYAKTHPGLTFGSTGVNGFHHLSVELFSQCKGLNLKHIPYSGGAESITAILGKHIDLVAGSAHIPYVQQGKLRLLMNYSVTKRDPLFPDVPTQKELGCPDYPGDAMMVVGPKGLPEPIVKKLNDAFKKVAESPDFQKMLTQRNLPYSYKDGAELNKEAPALIQNYKELNKKLGITMK
jgi:tripartite-type tricarboxylate transporter receptor subunit TctC